MNKDNQLLLTIVCSGMLAGIIAVVVSYAFMRGPAKYIVRDEAARQVERKHTEYRMFILPETAPAPTDRFRFNPVGKAFKYRVLGDSNGLVAGVYVRFSGGDQTYMAEVKSPWHEDRVIKLQRGDDFGIIELGSPKRGIKLEERRRP